MLLTEDEARQKWCPWARISEGVYANSTALTAVNRPWKWLRRKLGWTGVEDDMKCGIVNCIASECMQWDWVAPAQIERKVYDKSAEGRALLEARFPKDTPNTRTFEFDGHRWQYKWSDFDDEGEYDLIVRPNPGASKRGFCTLGGLEGRPE